jgi:hypothetical protein
MCKRDDFFDRKLLRKTMASRLSQLGWLTLLYSECTSEGRDLFDILYKKRQMFSFGICYSPHFCLHNQYFVSLRPSEKKEKEPLFFSKNSGEIH